MNSIWSNIASRGDLAVCEPVINKMPALPQRSWAHHLQPMNVGTLRCESLTSFFTRLSQAHCITPRTLFIRGMTSPSQSIYRFGLSTNDNLGPPLINSNGRTAKKWLEKLEAITLRSDLRFLTFLPFRKTITTRETCRQQRAWCPSCLEEQAFQNIGVHEHLLWTHKYVSACPIHKRLLEIRCPHCNRNSSVLCGRMRPGVCVKCGKWLGQLGDKPCESARRANAV